MLTAALKSFPFYKQPDSMDCGPTCLRMVAKHNERGLLPMVFEMKDVQHLLTLDVWVEFFGCTAKGKCPSTLKPVRICKKM